jgi:hypothetical protein
MPLAESIRSLRKDSPEVEEPELLSVPVNQDSIYSEVEKVELSLVRLRSDLKDNFTSLVDLDQRNSAYLQHLDRRLTDISTQLAQQSKMLVAQSSQLDKIISMLSPPLPVSFRIDITTT